MAGLPGGSLAAIGLFVGCLRRNAVCRNAACWLIITADKVATRVTIWPRVALSVSGAKKQKREAAVEEPLQ